MMPDVVSLLKVDMLLKTMSSRANHSNSLGLSTLKMDEMMSFLFEVASLYLPDDIDVR